MQLGNGELWKPIDFQGHYKVKGQGQILTYTIFQLWQPCYHCTGFIPWPILTKLGMQLGNGEVWKPIDFPGHRFMFLTGPSVSQSVRQSSLPCYHCTAFIPWPILIKLGMQLGNGEVWKPIDFQGHRSKVKVKFQLRLFFSYGNLVTTVQASFLDQS